MISIRFINDVFNLKKIFSLKLFVNFSTFFFFFRKFLEKRNVSIDSDVSVARSNFVQRRTFETLRCRCRWTYVWKSLFKRSVDFRHWKYSTRFESNVVFDKNFLSFCFFFVVSVGHFYRLILIRSSLLVQRSLKINWLSSVVMISLPVNENDDWCDEKEKAMNRFRFRWNRYDLNALSNGVGGDRRDSFDLNKIF